MAKFNLVNCTFYRSVHVFLFVSRKKFHIESNSSSFNFRLFFSILPESPRWLVSRARFDEAEKVLRQIADENKRTFDPNAFQQVKDEQEKV